MMMTEPFGGPLRERLLQRRPELRSVVCAAVDNDLAGKIASHDIRLSQL